MPNDNETASRAATEVVRRIVLGEEAASRWACGEVRVQEQLIGRAQRAANKFYVTVQLIEPSSGLVLCTVEPDVDPPTQPYRPRVRRDTQPYWTARPCTDNHP